MSYIRFIFAIVNLLLAALCFFFTWKERSSIAALLGAAATFIAAILLFLPSSARWPEGALRSGLHHYYIYENDASDWREAQRKCNERGGYLAVINNERENKALYKYMTEMGYDLAYFGLVRVSDIEWEYKYNTRSSSYEDWGKNSDNIQEPNNKDGGSHAAIDAHMHDGHWNDAEFGWQVYTPDSESYKNKTAYICEWDYFSN